MKGTEKQPKTNLVIDNLTEPLAIPMEHKPIHAHLLVARHTHPLDQPGLVAERAQRRHEPAVAVAALAHIVRRRPVNVKLGIIEDVIHALHRLGLERMPRPATRILTRPFLPPLCPALLLTTITRAAANTTTPFLQRRPLQLRPPWPPIPIPPPPPPPSPPPHTLTLTTTTTLAPVTAVGNLTTVLQPLVGERLEAVATARAQVKVEVEVRVAVLLVDAAALGDDLGDLGAAERRGLLVRGRRLLGRAARQVLGRGALGEAGREVVAREERRCWLRPGPLVQKASRGVVWIDIYVGG